MSWGPAAKPQPELSAEGLAMQWVATSHRSLCNEALHQAATVLPSSEGPELLCMRGHTYIYTHTVYTYKYAAVALLHLSCDRLSDCDMAVLNDGSC